MNKIVIPIVNRTNYSKIRPVALRLKDYIDIDIIVSSGALIGDYGTIRKDIETDGFKTLYFDTCMKSDRHEAMSKNVGLSMIQYSTYLKNAQPKMALIVGDRFDMLGFASASAFQNIPIAHIQGGERSGTIDDKIRFAITALADYHFPATEVAEQRIRACGAIPHTIFNFGCPAVEHIVSLYNGEPLDINGLLGYSKQELFLKSKEYILVQVHPNTTDENDVNMDELLKALERIGEDAIVIYPNIDATNHIILADMRKRRLNKKFYYYKHLALPIFVNVMANAKCFIGNSSSIIRESASFGIPAINLGKRQKNREQNENTFNCEFDSDKIVELYNRVENMEFMSGNFYYAEGASKKIAEKILEIVGG